MVGEGDVFVKVIVDRYEADEELVGEYTHVTMQVGGEGIAREGIDIVSAAAGPDARAAHQSHGCADSLGERVWGALGYGLVTECCRTMGGDKHLPVWGRENWLVLM